MPLKVVISPLEKVVVVQFQYPEVHAFRSLYRELVEAGLTASNVVRAIAAAGSLAWEEVSEGSVKP